MGFPVGERKLGQIRIRPLAADVLSDPALTTFHNKLRQRHGHEVNGDEPYANEVNRAFRGTRQTMLRMFREVPEMAVAHEDPELGHHAAAHVNRVEHTLIGLLIGMTDAQQQSDLLEHPEIVAATSLFPREHDLHQNANDHRNKVEGRSKEKGDKIVSKQGHDIAAGLIMLAQRDEHEVTLTEMFAGLPVTHEHLQEEALATGLIAMVISSAHGLPGVYEKTMSQERKAYDEVTNVPLAYATEAEAAALTKLYRKGEVDPFSLSIPQMMAIATWELTHPDKNVVNQDMSQYRYGVKVDGLHPLMEERYGGILQGMAVEYGDRPISDILGEEIMGKRELIERMGKFALLADTYDLMADTTGRVIRSLQSQKNFEGDRPLWPRGLKESDLPALFEWLETSNGRDYDESGATTIGHSLGRRMDWEARHWLPYKDLLHPAIGEQIGDVSVAAQLEHLRIIGTLITKPKEGRKIIDKFYEDRIAAYDAKAAQKEPGTVFSSGWLYKEWADTISSLTGGDPYTPEDIHVFNLFKEQTLVAVRERYKEYMTEERFLELQEMSRQGIPLELTLTPPKYDTVSKLRGHLPELRGHEPRNLQPDATNGAGSGAQNGAVLAYAD